MFRGLVRGSPIIASDAPSRSPKPDSFWGFQVLECHIWAHILAILSSPFFGFFDVLQRLGGATKA